MYLCPDPVCIERAQKSKQVQSRLRLGIPGGNLREEIQGQLIREIGFCLTMSDKMGYLSTGETSQPGAVLISDGDEAQCTVSGYPVYVIPREWGAEFSGKAIRAGFPLETRLKRALQMWDRLSC